MIIDESDEYVFMDPAAFKKFSKKTKCICLTATTSESYAEGIERNALRAMQFRIFDDLFVEQGLEIAPAIFQKMGPMPEEKILELIKEETSRQAMMIYCK